MAAGITRRDKFSSYNTLVCLIQAIEGRQTTIDLRGDTSVTGTIVQCDSRMNISMQNVLYRDQTGAPTIMDNMMIKSRLIRYVHIPADVDISSTMSRYIGKLSGTYNQPPKKASFKQSKLLQRQATTLQEVQRIKMERRKEQEKD